VGGEIRRKHSHRVINDVIWVSRSACMLVLVLLLLLPLSLAVSLLPIGHDFLSSLYYLGFGLLIFIHPQPLALQVEFKCVDFSLALHIICCSGFIPTFFHMPRNTSVVSAPNTMFRIIGDILRPLLCYSISPFSILIILRYPRLLLRILLETHSS
jgi:hypothetical protein